MSSTISRLSSLAADDAPEPVIRHMTGADVEAAELIFRLAFGTEFGLPDPLDFRRNARLVAGRFAMNPEGGTVVTVDGEVMGFSMASRWGALGLLGPVCVHPKMWNKGLARRLVQRTVECIDGWRCTSSGLFTNPASPRHLRLYQSFGYQPGHLVVIMDAEARESRGHRNYDIASRQGDPKVFAASAFEVTRRAAPGLDLSPEIFHLARNGSGETLFGATGSKIAWFAVCHFGCGSEAEAGELYVKFAIVDGQASHHSFEEMIFALKDFAALRGLSHISLGVSVGRPALYNILLTQGFKGRFHGVLMHRPSNTPFERRDSIVLEDWR